MADVGVLRRSNLSSCQVEWAVNKLILISAKYGESVGITSKCFSLSNITWCILMFPNSRFKENSMSIQLETKSTLTERLFVTTAFGIKKNDGSVFYPIREVFELKSDHRFSREEYLDRDILSSTDCLQNDNLTIVCNITLDNASSETTSEVKIDPVLVQNLEDLFLSKRESDVIIEVKGNKFKSHRSILAARSTVFADMIQQNMAEMNNVLVETDCEPQCFKKFLLYLYTGKSDLITIDEAVGLYHMASKYVVKDLKVKCVECMVLKLSIYSICDVLVLMLATLETEQELLQGAMEFFINNMEDVVQTENWSLFQCKHPNLVTELFLKIAGYMKK